MLIYTIVLIPEKDGSAVNVKVPAMPNVLTWGCTDEEAVASAREAIALHLESYVERNQPFPHNKKLPRPLETLARLRKVQVLTLEFAPPTRPEALEGAPELGAFARRAVGD